MDVEVQTHPGKPSLWLSSLTHIFSSPAVLRTMLSQLVVLLAIIAVVAARVYTDKPTHQKYLWEVRQEIIMD